MHIVIKIEGISALICNRFSDAAAEASTTGTRGASAAADRGTPNEQAEARLYIGLAGKPMIPQPNLLRCLVDGGRFHKIGKKQLTTQRESMLFGCVDIAAVEIPIEFKQPWRVDTRAVRIPSTGGRILCHRPTFDDWALEFELTLDTDILGVNLLRSIIDDAGKRIGLGDFRPACKGPYGRFKVVQWEVLKEVEPAMQIAAE